MKVGIECEGILKGLKTLFIETNELDKALDFLNKPNNIEQIYISDHDNKIVDYQFYCNLLPRYSITIEQTQITVQDIPRKIHLILRVDKCPSHLMFYSVRLLRPWDQIKFEKEKLVYIFPMSSVIKTTPDEFEGDIEID
jgi:hypothetical protein